ncbi:MAG: TIGR01212 family radical SAM protein, partial [Pirellulaceae bacterium]|nr:TIGR01212 family radical SAM protein [Pirellulaceae bacterium]
DQIDHGIQGLKRRYRCDHFMAYFQPATNTYADVDVLRRVYTDALSHPDVIALAIGTRPDCVPDDVLELLEEISRDTYLSVEYGLQTMHDKSLEWMNRGHGHAVSVEAMERSRGRGFEICAHVMLGLPGETHDDMMDTANEIARLGFDSVKIHNLYAVRNTPLAEQVESGEVELMGQDRYVETLIDFLELLPPGMVVERISGDAPPDYLVGPAWCTDKSAIRTAVQEEWERRDSWQGKRWRESCVEVS